MKSAIITRNSSLDDIREQLSGTWGSVKGGNNGEFVLTRTPFFTVLTGALSAGKHILPVTSDTASVLKWANDHNSGNILVKARQSVVELPESAVVELIYWAQPS